MLDPDIPPEAEEEAEGAVGVALIVAAPDATVNNMAASIPRPWIIAIEQP